MGKAIFLIVLFLILALLQTSFFNFFKASFNLVLVLFLVLAFFYKKKIGRGLFLSFIAGFFLDIFSGVPFGANILTFVLVFIILNFILNFISDANIVEVIFLIFWGVILYNLFVPLFGFGLGKILGQTLPLKFGLNYWLALGQFINLIFASALFIFISNSTKIKKYILEN